MLISQEHNLGSEWTFNVTKNNVMLFKVADDGDGIIESGETATQVQLKSNQVEITNGNVTIKNFTPDAADSLYIISVKYDTNSVTGVDVGKDSTLWPEINYTFKTDVGADDKIETKGITLAPKFGALTLNGDAVQAGHAPVLQTAELQHVVNQAINFWAQQGVDAVDLAVL